MATPSFLEEIARARGCSVELARDLITDALAALHEASYKNGTTTGVEVAHAELGSLATWHLMGLLVDAADSGNPGALVRAYVRVEDAPSQYDHIWEDWKTEKQTGK
jgi:hypothetical protein